MLLLKRISFAITLFFASISKGFKVRLIKFLYQLKFVLKKESKETKRMLEIYYRYPKGKASRTDVKWANEQLKDIFRTLGVGALLILPFAPLTLPLMVKLGKKLGVNILPDSFHQEPNDNYENNEK